jgi:excisionase family DNA binding protein
MAQTGITVDLGKLVSGEDMTLLTFPDRTQKRKAVVIQPHKPYLSTEEVADLFGFSVRTITAWAAEWHESGGVQGLPAFKMGRSWRFDRQQIQAYIERKRLPVQPIERNTATA